MQEGGKAGEGGKEGEGWEGGDSTHHHKIETELPDLPTKQLCGQKKGT